MLPEVKEKKMSEKKSEKKRRGLGRGLSALMGNAPNAPIDTKPQTPAPPSDMAADTPENTGLKIIGVDQLQPGRYQPRRHFDETELQDLAKSLKEKGVLQPLLVRPLADAARTDDAAYEIVAGERRWRAAQLAGLHEVPAIVRVLSDTEALEIGIIENVQRADLNPIEEATAYQRLLDEFNYTQDALAKTLGKSRSHVANTLRLGGVSEKIRRHLIEGQLSAGHARTLLGYGDADILAQKIISEGLSVRAVEKIVAQDSAGKSNSKNAAGAGASKHVQERSQEKDADTRALEKSLEESLGLNVKIAHKGSHQSEAGAVTISYKSLEQLDDVVRRLMVSRPHGQ